MHPELCRIGPLTVYTYGFFSALAMLLVYAVSLSRAEAKGFSKDFISDFIFWVFVAGIAGARLEYVLQNGAEFQSHPLTALWIWQGGLVWYGGMIAATLTGWGLAHFRRQKIAKLADFLAPVLALAHGVGRIGCFFNGCCGGKILFGFQQPVQLYESVGLFLLAGILFWMSKRPLKAGSVFVSYLACYGLLRFLLEFWRQGQTILAGLTVPQWISVGLIVLSGVLWKKLK